MATTDALPPKAPVIPECSECGAHHYRKDTHCRSTYQECVGCASWRNALADAGKTVYYRNVQQLHAATTKVDGKHVFVQARTPRR